MRKFDFKKKKKKEIKKIYVLLFFFQIITNRATIMEMSAEKNIWRAEKSEIQILMNIFVTNFKLISGISSQTSGF